MNIRTLTYSLWHRLEDGTIPDDSRFTYRELKGYIRSAIASAMKRNFFENLNADDFRYGDDSVVTTYTNIPVFTEPDTGLQYIELPAQTVSIAGGRNIDIHDRNPLSNWANEFIPIRREEHFVAKLQTPIPCVINFFRKGKKVYFMGNLDSSVVDVTQSYSLPINDEADLALPPEYELDIIAQALELVAPKIAQADKENNGVHDN